MKTLRTITLLLAFVAFQANGQNTRQQLSDAAISLTHEEVQYDPSYFSIPYPMGDIPKGKGVCTDVIIRAYRVLGIDLQQLVHVDMKNNFHLYPKRWGLKHTDKNIDHRRVPNLMTFFQRKGVQLKGSTNINDYQPGEIVCWDLGNGVRHIGITINQRSRDNKRWLIVHNIGSGQVIQDCLFDYKIIGHYKYHPKL